MDDILASIRRIIADDQSRQNGAAGLRAALRAPVSQPAPPSPVAGAPAAANPDPGPSAAVTASPAALDLGTAKRPPVLTPPSRPAEEAPGSRQPAPPVFGRAPTPGLSGSAPHLNPPPPAADRSVFEEIASAGVASALRTESRPAPAAVTIIELGPVDAASDGPAPNAGAAEPVPPAPEPEAALPQPGPPTLAAELSAPEPSGSPDLHAASPMDGAGASQPFGAAVEPDRAAEPLVSAAAFAAIEHSFQALAASMVMQNAGQLDTTVREILRPLLKSWLDDNLPAIVERLVRAEIERVARGAKA